jgi:hypothetical protein
VSAELALPGEVPAPANLVPVDPGADVDLDVWAAQLVKASDIARAIGPTQFVPKSLRVYYRPENSSRDEVDIPATIATVAAAVLTGKEVGFSPMAALRSIDIIEGAPALRAVALRALILRAGHDMWVVESTSTRAIVAGVRAGSTHEQSSTWTLDRAKAAQLTGKTNWQRHPGAMLVARATAEVARLIAPDVLLGLPYTVEELADGPIDDEPLEATSPPPAKPRTAQRKPRPKPIAPADAGVPEDDPPFEDSAAADVGADDPVPDADEPVPDLATKAQVTAVRRALAGVGIGTAAGQLDAVQRITGRKVDALAELYAAEAAVVLQECAKRQKAVEDAPSLPADDGDRWDEYLATNPVEEAP